MAVTFEGYERRVEKINACLAENGIASLEEAEQICLDKGVNAREIVHDTQSIAFQNAEWAYTLGCALAIKKGAKSASEAAAIIGEGIQAFTVPGSVAEDRKVGLGHGNLGAMLLSDDTECFAFLAGHESFAAAEGAIKLALNANKARKTPLRVILNGLGKDAAQIIARINGFTYVKTQFDYFTGELKVVETIPYSDGPRAAVNCYGADDVREGVAIMWHENVDISITGNSTNPTRFQHPTAGTYKKERLEAGKKYFSVASGWRYRPHPAPGQHGRRPCLLRHDRHHGPYALRRPVRRLLLRARARRHDGPHRHGQQPHGRCHRRLRRRRERRYQRVAFAPRETHANDSAIRAVTFGWRPFFLERIPGGGWTADRRTRQRAHPPMYGRDSPQAHERRVHIYLKFRRSHAISD